MSAELKEALRRLWGEHAFDHRNATQWHRENCEVATIVEVARRVAEADDKHRKAVERYRLLKAQPNNIEVYESVSGIVMRAADAALALFPEHE